MANYIAEADGGSRGNPGPAAYGALVRDAATFNVIAEAKEYLGTQTNNYAEYCGLIAALELVKQLDPSATVEVRMDSKLVVEQMSGNWKIKHPVLRELAIKARGILPHGQVSYKWVRRDDNFDADLLVNQALDSYSS
ncbi:MAG: reverse transcriptase-like protein [Candidatus Nanopelagicales bacterium]